MKNLLLRRATYFVLLLLSIGLNNNVFAQDEGEDKPVEEDECCWCKFTEKRAGSTWIVNVDSMVARNPDKYEFINNCGCGGCEERICVFKRKEYTGIGVWEWKEKTGECTTEVFGDVDPWDKDGAAVPGEGRAAEDDEGEEEEESCDCIEKLVTPTYIIYSNITERIADQDPYGLVQIKMVRECDQANCGSNKCIYAIYNYPKDTIIVRQGVCTDKYVSGRDDKEGEVVEGGGGGGDDHNKVTDFDGNEIPTDEGLSFYPNPASAEITITGSGNIKTTLLSISGQVVLETAEKQIDVQHLKPGIYIILMESTNGVLSKQLIIK